MGKNTTPKPRLRTVIRTSAILTTTGAFMALATPAQAWGGYGWGHRGFWCGLINEKLCR